MIQGETLQSGAPLKCADCGQMPTDPMVLRSAAGWYIGTWCQCGPYSRESGYHRTNLEAVQALESGRYGR